MMIQTDFVLNGKDISYEIKENGYDIYLDGVIWITQPEPYIPYRELGYEGSCLKQIEELCSIPDPVPDQTDDRIKALEEENAFLNEKLNAIYEKLGMMEG